MNELPDDKAPAGTRTRPWRARRRLRIVVLLAVAGIATWFWVLSRPDEWRPSKPDERFTRIFEEVMSVENLTRAPVPSAAGNLLATLRGSPRGRSLFLLDTHTGRETQVPVQNDIRRIADWSPHGRFLAFEQRPPFSEATLKKRGSRPLAEDLNESWLTLYDTQSHRVWRLTTNRKVNEKWFVWLTDSTFLFSVDSDDDSVRGNYLGRVDSHTLELASDYLHDFVRMAERKGAYVKEKNIFTFELPPPGANARQARGNQVSDFKAMGFDSLRWLRYSPPTGCFLFCARPTNSTWRYLYEFDPGPQRLTQLTAEDTYNGQYLEGGRGYAYVGNSNNSFFLAVRSADRQGWTNLFTRGSVANYVADGRRGCLYATASTGIEPQGLWMYDLSTRGLRQIWSGMAGARTVCQWVEPQEHRAKSYDGLEIPYFVMEPVKPGEKEESRQPRRFPVILYLPPQTMQFQRCFEARSQLMANLGFFFVAINYRGCDGYGRVYSDLDNPEAAARDVLAVYHEICRDTRVDPRNVFLWTSSSGSAAARELLAAEPRLWRGAALISPAGLAGGPLLHAENLPPLLLTSGDQDSALESLRQFKSWASSAGGRVRLVVYKDSGHINYNTRQVRENRQLVARFFLDHLEP